MNYLLTVKYPKQEVIEDGKESVTNVKENHEDLTSEELLEKYQDYDAGVSDAYIEMVKQY